MPAPSSDSCVTVSVNVLGHSGSTHESLAGQRDVLSRLAVQMSRMTPVILPAWPDPKMARGLVLVAVDGDAGSTEALRWAFDEAVMRGGELEVIQAISPDASCTEMSIQQRDLSEMLADWRSDFPGLAVRIDVTRGDPARLLIEASAAAAVVVTRHLSTGGLPSSTFHPHDRDRDKELVAV